MWERQGAVARRAMAWTEAAARLGREAGAAGMEVAVAQLVAVAVGETGKAAVPVEEEGGSRGSSPRNRSRC